MQTNSATTFRSSDTATMTAIFGAYEFPMALQPVDLVQVDEDDDVMDSWLASLAPREFETILNDLASNAQMGRFALEPTA